MLVTGGGFERLLGGTSHRRNFLACGFLHILGQQRRGTGSGGFQQANRAGDQPFERLFDVPKSGGFGGSGFSCLARDALNVLSEPLGPLRVSRSISFAEGLVKGIQVGHCSVLICPRIYSGGLAHQEGFRRGFLRRGLPALYRDLPSEQ